MTSTTSLSLNSKLDLRAAVFTRLRRGTGVRWRKAQRGEILVEIKCTLALSSVGAK